MAPIVAKSQNKRSAQQQPRVLVVDDEPALIELVDDVIGSRLQCKIVPAGTIAEARKILASQTIELMVADINLPDGKGTALLPALQKSQPNAGAIVITGTPSMDGAISAIRDGAFDFLPKPFTADHLLERIKGALARQAAHAKRERRLDRLRDAVRRLNEARRTVSKKVDILCNDLISAYGELSKQLDVVRVQESFRKALAQSNDLEQMLCHAMDWVLRQTGYTNIAVWLASDDDEFQLGAYMKYTIAGKPELTEAMTSGVVPMITRGDILNMTAEEAGRTLTPEELVHLHDQAVLGVNCTYLGEPLAAVVLFRDGKTGFADADVAALQSIASIFANSLASIVRAGNVETEGDHEDETPGDEDPAEPQMDLDSDIPFKDEPKKQSPKGKKPKKDDADWWKRGEAPPF